MTTMVVMMMIDGDDGDMVMTTLDGDDDRG